MILSAPRMAPYLLEIGLLTNDVLLTENVYLERKQRRNNNFLVSIENRNGFFIKQPLPEASNNQQTIERESLWYQTIQADRSHPLHLNVPRISAYDVANSILILELVEASAASQLQQAGLNPALAKSLGELLGNWHRQTAAAGYNALPESLRARIIPHAFEIPAMARSAHPHNRALAQLSKILDESPALCDRLHNVRSQWTADSCIHTDLRLDNILYAPNSEKPLCLVDLELMSWGDSLWDAAYCLHNYILRWLMAIPISPDTSVSEIEAIGGQELLEMQRVAPVFWAQYLKARCFPEALTLDTWEKLAHYVALALLQSSYEHSVFEPQITTHAIYLLQLCENALTQPSQFLFTMLNLERI